MERLLLVGVENPLLVEYIREGNYIFTIAENREEALHYMNQGDYSLLLLDVNKDLEAFRLCLEIRRFSEIPIILLSDSSNKKDIIKGFNAGADDYLTKPVDPGELLARMRALLRRTMPKKEIEINGLYWNEDCFKLTYREKPIKLTPKEFMLLGHFMKHPNQVFSRDQLISLLWGYTSVTDVRTVDSHIQNIRGKIENSGFPIKEYFKTIWGVGYQWVYEKKRAILHGKGFNFGRDHIK